MTGGQEQERGQGRQKVTVSLTEDDARLLEEVARVSGRSVSDVIRDALGLTPLAPAPAQEGNRGD